MSQSNIPVPDLSNPYNGKSKGYISQLFGGNADMYKGYGLKGHNGIDIAFKHGEPDPIIKAIEGGEVVRARYDVGSPKGGFGQYVRIHTPIAESQIKNVPPGTAYIDRPYGHMGWLASDGSPGDVLDGLLVKEGQIVKRGDPIGKMGSTGFSTGRHVHIGRRYLDKNKAVINPNDGYGGYVDNYEDIFLIEEVMSNVKILRDENSSQIYIGSPVADEAAFKSYCANYGIPCPLTPEGKVDWPKVKINGLVRPV